MNTVTAMLMIIINNSYQHDTNYDIACTLLKYYTNIDQLTVSELTQTCSTSTAYVNKFCKMLGFKSFSELKFNLKNGYSVRKVQMDSRMEKMNEEEILNSIKALSTVEFDCSLLKSQVYRLVQLIHDEKHIQILGAYYPTCLSVNFQEDLLAMGKFVRICPQVYQFNIEKVEGLTIIITLTGRIYEFNRGNFEELCAKHHPISIISGNKEIVNEYGINIPIDDDQEKGNLLMIEILRYVRFVYYTKNKQGWL